MLRQFRYLVLSSMILLIACSVYSQEYLISQGGSITTCSGTLYDSGGPDGDYSSSEDYIITLSSDEPGATLSIYFSEFSLESGTYDNLTIYNGDSDLSPVLMPSSGGSSLVNETIFSTSGFLTLKFHSDGSVTYPGFAAEISCAFPCQEFSISLDNIDPYITNLDSMWVDICVGEDISFSGIGDYPNNNEQYEQSDENISWHWNFTTNIISDSITGEGLNEIEYSFDVPGGYFVSLYGEDLNGCVSEAVGIRVRTSLIPDFSNTLVEENICFGETIFLEGNMVEDTFRVEVSNSTFEQLCFSDDVGVWQTSCFSLFSQSKNSIISSIDDIESVCANIEHSYLGDLDIVLECPNGQSIYLQTQSCGGTYLGEPNQSDDCIPGVGWDYCWTMDATTDISSNCNSGGSLASGDYLPVDSFIELVGCPVDGDWCIKFLDNISSDDGIVFSININLADGVVYENSYLWSYENSYDTSSESTDLVWTGIGVEENEGGVTSVTPEIASDYIYTYSVTDNWGCTHDTSFNVIVHPQNDPFCDADCGSEVYTNLADTIGDGSGEDYLSQNDLNCSWLINPESKSNNVIFVSWKEFSTAMNDVVTVYDGASTYAPIIGEYSGHNLPENIVSSGNALYITYFTDGDIRSAGWRLFYETILVDKPQELLSELYVFPNPANTKITIGGVANTCNLNVYDLSGRIYHTIENYKNEIVDISSLAPGVYIVKLNSETESKTLKFVKE